MTSLEVHLHEDEDKPNPIPNTRKRKKNDVGCNRRMNWATHSRLQGLEPVEEPNIRESKAQKTVEL